MNNSSKKKTKRLVVCVCMLFVSTFLILQGSKVIYTTLSMKKSVKENEEKSLELDKKKEKLEEEKKNLSNPDYIEYIARGKYLVTKQGEQVFKFPSLEAEEKD